MLGGGGIFRCLSFTESWDPDCKALEVPSWNLQVRISGASMYQPREPEVRACRLEDPFFGIKKGVSEEEA